jgi:DNA-binding Lrp family transcriptional regulator
MVVQGQERSDPGMAVQGQERSDPGMVVQGQERSDPGMVEAFMLIQTEVGRAEVVAKQLAMLPGVVAAEYVTGPYDVVVRVAAETMDKLRSDVVAPVQRTTGITRTLTCPIATKAPA